MAKLSALEVFNAVARNCGEEVVTGLTNLSGLQLVIWDKITEALQDICVDQDTRWSFLESLGVIPLSTGNNAYTITSLTTGSNTMIEDRESFRQADSKKNITYITPQEFDLKYPQGITSDRTGYPDLFTKYGGQFIFDKQAGANENEKNISFRNWKFPTYYSTATNSSTSDLPEPFDRTLLVALATLKVLTYLGNDEASIYKVQVFGNGSDIEGSLDKMKRIHTSPTLKPRFTAIL